MCIHKGIQSCSLVTDTTRDYSIKGHLLIHSIQGYEKFKCRFNFYQNSFVFD